MNKELSFGSVSKPGRITAPGFVLVRRGEAATAALRTTALRAMTAVEEDGSWEEVVSAAAYLGAQLAAEKIPVNFLLFTESADLRSQWLC